MSGTCKHCWGHIVSNDGANWVHTTPSGHVGKARCDPEKSGLPYGYNADPDGAACTPICLGAPR